MYLQKNYVLACLVNSTNMCAAQDQTEKVIGSFTSFGLRWVFALAIAGWAPSAGAEDWEMALVCNQ